VKSASQHGLHQVLLCTSSLLLADTKRSNNSAASTAATTAPDDSTTEDIVCARHTAHPTLREPLRFPSLYRLDRRIVRDSTMNENGAGAGSTVD
jgi:hypothetical protein